MSAEPEPRVSFDMIAVNNFELNVLCCVYCEGIVLGVWHLPKENKQPASTIALIFEEKFSKAILCFFMYLHIYVVTYLFEKNSI